MLKRIATTCLCIPLFGCFESSQATFWEGYVYTQTETGLEALPNAFTELYDIEGTLLTTGIVPNGRPSNFNQLILEDGWADQPCTLRVGGDESQTIQWAGRIPTGAATWIPGAVFGIEPSFLNAFFNSFAEPAGVILEDAVHLWGEPLYPTEWIGAEFLLIDIDGTEYPIYPYSQLDTGLISSNTTEKIDWFFAWNLPAKPLILTVSMPDGRSIETTYHPKQGDILSALYYTLPSVEEE